jgi:hypothetical protein
MKYIITESKINKLVSSYLDNQNLETSDIGNGDFNITDGKHGNDVIRYEIDHSSTYPEKSYHTILISDDLVTKITQLFGLKSDDSINSIINWFNQEYDLNVDIHDFEWLSSDDDYYDEDYDDEEYYD